MNDEMFNAYGRILRKYNDIRGSIEMLETLLDCHEWTGLDTIKIKTCLRELRLLLEENPRTRPED